MWKTHLPQPALLSVARTELGMSLESMFREHILVMCPPWHEGQSQKVTLGRFDTYSAPC